MGNVYTATKFGDVFRIKFALSSVVAREKMAEGLDFLGTGFRCEELNFKGT